MALLASLLSLGEFPGGRPAGDRRATPENPAFGLNDPKAWDVFLSARAADTGERVTPDRALTYSPWWRGVTLISRDVGKLPLVTYKLTRSAQGVDRDADPKHPAYPLLRWRPNPFQTDIQFKQTLTACALTRGNGYAYVWRRNDGTPLELLPLDPDTVTPFRLDGEQWYKWDQPGASGPPKVLPASAVYHVMGLSLDGMAGLPVWEYARQALGLGLAGKRHQATRFRNGARPGVVLETAAKLTDQAAKRLREEWERMHSGLENNHRTAILDNGLVAKTLTMSAADMQEAEQTHMTAADVANFLGVPVHKVDPLAPGRTAYASLEQENLSYLTDGLDYWLCQHEREARRKLLTPAEQDADSHAVEFDRKRLLAADLKTLAEYHRTALAGQPWETVNEARYELGLPPSPEETAGKIQSPLNMGQGGAQNAPADPADPPPGRPARRGKKKAGSGQSLFPDAAETRADPAVVAPVAAAPTPPPPVPEEALAAVAEAARDAMRRAAKRIGTHAAKAAARPRDFLAWLEATDGLAAHAGPLTDILAPAWRADAALAGAALDPGAAVAELVDDVRHSLLDLSGRCNDAQLRPAVDRWAADFEAGWPDHRYNPSQPRGPDGKWAGGAGAGGRADAAPLAGAVVSRKPLGGGVNTTEKVTLEGGAVGVWKPASGERPGLRKDVPDGTNYKREAAASAAAGVLGMADMVPATITREVGGEVGSVQAFLGNAMGADKATNPFDGEAGHARAAAFDYVIGQTDRHPGNWMLAERAGGGVGDRIKKWVGAKREGGDLRLIDNGLSLPVREDVKHFTNQDLLRGAVGKKLPDLSHWEGRRGDFERALRDSGVEDAAVRAAGGRLDAAVAAAKAGKTFGDLPYGGSTVAAGMRDVPIGFRVVG